MKPINSDRLKALRTGFKSLYDSSFLGVKNTYQNIAMIVPSTTSEMTYGWLGQNFQIREWLGDRVVQNLKEHGFTIRNKSYEGTVSVSRPSIEDDNVGQYTPLFQMMGYNAAIHPDELSYKLLLSGFDTVCYDGQYFFDTDHPVVNAQGQIVSVSNTGGGGGNPWFLIDASKPIKPIIYQDRKKPVFTALDNPDDPNVFNKNEFVYGVDSRGNVGFALWQLAYGSKQTLDHTSYEAGLTAMMGFKADGGKSLGIVPTLLVVGPSNWKKAKDVVEAEKLANGGTNTMQGTTKILLVNWLP